MDSISSASKHVSQYFDFEPSLHKWKQRGLDNIHRVRQTGRNVRYPRFIHNTWNSLTSYTDELRAPDNDAKARSQGQYKVARPARSRAPKKNRYSESTISLTSDANTLVNSNASTTSFSRFRAPKPATTSNSFGSVGSGGSSPNDYSSTTSLSSAATPVPEELLEYVEKPVYTLTFKDDEVVVKEEEIIEELDIKTYINTYNYENAFEFGKVRHLHYYELPFPWRENRCIINGYRFYNSHKKSLLSIVNWYGWHNETSNIWTHLLGGLYILYLMFYQFPCSEVFMSEQVPKAAKLITYVFLIAAAKCLFSSVFWHTFNGTSLLRLRCKFACVDYSGISILITASILTTEFVTMYQCPWAMVSYMALSTALGIFGVFMNWSPKFDRPEARPLRIKFFILLASMGILSFLHLTFITSLSHSTWLLSPITKKSVVWYLVGVVFYGSFIPERWRTDIQYDHTIPTSHELSTNVDIINKEKHIHFRETPTPHEMCKHHEHHHRSFKSLWWVDYVGCSHTLWHFFVVLGVIGHYRAILDILTKKWILSGSPL